MLGLSVNKLLLICCVRQDDESVVNVLRYTVLFSWQACSTDTIAQPWNICGFRSRSCNFAKLSRPPKLRRSTDRSRTPSFREIRGSELYQRLLALLSCCPKQLDLVPL